MKQSIFQSICTSVFSTLNKNEQLTIYLEGEDSQYFRFNDSKLRQTGIIEDYNVVLSLYHGKKSLQANTTISIDIDFSVQNLTKEIENLRDPLSDLSEDQYTRFPKAFPNKITQEQGSLPSREEILNSIMKIISKNLLTGVWTSGKIFRGFCSSNGTRHWFEKDSFIFDYSLIDTQENMVKVLYSGSHWSRVDFETDFDRACDRLQLMNKPKKELQPGKYRVWFEPHAVADFVDMFNWHGAGESYFQNGSSCLLKMRSQNVHLSPLFTLLESFKKNPTASFNSRGEISEEIPLIRQGKLVNTLINDKSALEHNLISNYAEETNSWGMGEFMRAPYMTEGDLKEEDILNRLDTGIFISNIHYLNWSDALGGRITGLTRYACYWVEKGKLIAPIKTMRFDDFFYNFFGKNLEAVGRKVLARPVIETYDGRNPGSTMCPGVLVNNFELTL